MPVLTKTSAKKLFADVPENKRFWVSDGRTLRNLADWKQRSNR